MMSQTCTFEDHIIDINDYKRFQKVGGCPTGKTSAGLGKPNRRCVCQNIGIAVPARRPTRSYRKRWLWLSTLIGSAAAQGAALVGYGVTRPEPVPSITIELAGEGQGQVLVTKLGDGTPLMRCATTSCSISVPRGTVLQLSSIVGEDSTFGGYYPEPSRIPFALQPLLGDPLAQCVVAGSGANPAESMDDIRDPLLCAVTVVADSKVVVDFGKVPDKIDVAILAAPLEDKTVIEPPAPTAPKVEKKKAPKPDAIKAPPPVEIAILPPPKVDLVPPPPPPPPPPPKAPEKLPANMTAVEVPDKNEVKEAPDDATHISDKNRDVAEETAAKDTNLEKAMDGKQVASLESKDTTSADIGGPDDKIAQTETTEATSDKKIATSDQSGQNETAKGGVIGKGGESGEEGTGETRTPGVLSMRGIGGRGALTEQKDGDGKKAGKKGLPGLDRAMAFTDYERIMGKEKVDEERELAAKKLAAKKGRYQRKLDAMKSALENFTPDVRHGNQTALKTRAHPFGIYLARMHRRIHELWGFGYLEDLSGRGADDPLNNPELWVNLEVVLNPDGTVYKTTIAKTSGKLEFDVAAIDTIESGGPYQETPEVIRSVDQRVYLRWGFHRDWRQCGTFNVEPYILSDIPGGIVPISDGASATQKKPTKAMSAAQLATPADDRTNEKAPTSSVKDKEALFAANEWVTGFATAQMDKLIENTQLPFVAGDATAAQTKADLKDLYTELLVDTGAMRTWKLYTGDEYQKLVPATVKLGDGKLVLVITTAKGSFAIVMTKQNDSKYRASQISR
jgi:outer membrane biosynthesis protein TonB